MNIKDFVDQELSYTESRYSNAQSVYDSAFLDGKISVLNHIKELLEDED